MNERDVDAQKLAYAIRQRRGERGLRETVAEIGHDVSAAALSRLEQGRGASVDLNPIISWLGMTADDVNAIVIPEKVYPTPKRLSSLQWSLLGQLCGDGVYVYSGHAVRMAIHVLEEYGFVAQQGKDFRATPRAEKYHADHAGEYIERPKYNNPTEIAKWSAAWLELNKRQQDCMTVFYEGDQAAERWNKGAFNRGEYSRPASEWRWLGYNTINGLYASLHKLGHRDKGTGSTLTALEKRGYILVKYERSDIPDHPLIYVQVTPKGRKLLRYGNHIERSGT